MFRKVNEGWMSFLVRFFNSLGFYIFTPLLALWLTETKSLDLSKASIIVASLTLFSKAGGAFKPHPWIMVQRWYTDAYSSRSFFFVIHCPVRIARYYHLFIQCRLKNANIVYE